MTIFIQNSRKFKLIDNDSRSVVTWRGGSGRRERLQRGTRKLLRVKKTFAVLIIVMVLWVYKYINADQRVNFTYV